MGTKGRTEHAQAHAHYTSRYWHLPQSNPSAPRDLGASLPLSPKLVPPTTSTSVQVIQCTLLCWTYGLIGRNQNKPGVIVFLLASTIWRQGHAAHSLVGAGP